MRTVWLGVLLSAGLAVAAGGASLTPNGAAEERPVGLPPGEAQSGLIAFSNVVEGKYQQVTVIDPERMAMSVYHVDLASGVIELKCVRTIHWDLQMTCYNGKGLLPQEIHSLQEQPR
jgi:hypothetical protein